ncbi:MAG: branched-chain amino acid ABC transporter permease, partial [Bacilli bacterium]
SMVVIGGLGSIRGTLFGVTLLYLLPELFRLFKFDFIDMKYLDMYKMIIYGLLMVFVMRYRPKGIFGRAGAKLNPRQPQKVKSLKDGADHA